MVVLRTIESSTRITRLPSSTSRSGVYLVAALALRRHAAFDEGAAGVAIADQAFAAGQSQVKGHRVGRRFAGIGHRHDDRVFGVERHAAIGQFGSRQFFAQPRAAEVDAAVVQRAGDIGEIDPLEKAVRRAGASWRSG